MGSISRTAAIAPSITVPEICLLLIFETKEYSAILMFLLEPVNSQKYMFIF